MMREFLLAFTSIFVALDIIGAVPIYLSMTHSLDQEERRVIVNKSMSVAFVVAVMFVFAGQEVFRHIGVTLFDFKIAGGLILLLIALADLLGGPEAAKTVSGSTGVVPIGVPLITGPGVLTAVILLAGTYGYMVTLAALSVNYLVAWILLRKSDIIQRKIGKDGTVVLSKIAALLLAAIAVAMIRGGIFDAVGAFRAQ